MPQKYANKHLNHDKYHANDNKPLSKISQQRHSHSHKEGSDKKKNILLNIEKPNRNSSNIARSPSPKIFNKNLGIIFMCTIK